MRKTIMEFKRWVDCYRYMLAVAGISFGSMLLAFGASAWYYTGVNDEVRARAAQREAYYIRSMNQAEASHTAQVGRLQLTITNERDINRKLIGDIKADVSSMLTQIADIPKGAVQDATIQTMNERIDSLTAAIRAAKTGISTGRCTP